MTASKGHRRKVISKQGRLELVEVGVAVAAFGQNLGEDDSGGMAEGSEGIKHHKIHRANESWRIVSGRGDILEGDGLGGGEMGIGGGDSNTAFMRPSSTYNDGSPRIVVPDDDEESNE
ncbi:hypothetical protein KIN20_018637 [Parelaphostrongylus tenuis]|uniref:Uncharacterized protein n=1 Tax=Parelaphostrongylus tenuis TaxID=148309 RepID=A0AAD5N4H3_PARTN|nr:hypothetical protein KIN20_018637 [Parelaphostrongylus tenuis]